MWKMNEQMSVHCENEYQFQSFTQPGFGTADNVKESGVAEYHAFG